MKKIPLEASPSNMDTPMRESKFNQILFQYQTTGAKPQKNKTTDICILQFLLRKRMIENLENLNKNIRV